MRELKGWSASAGAERSGAGESSSASSRTRSLRSHAPTLRALLKRLAGARWRARTGRARPPELSDESERSKAGLEGADTRGSPPPSASRPFGARGSALPALCKSGAWRRLEGREKVWRASEHG
eukprot:3105106-Pleurochrysis_carterae.AAC.1